MSFEDTIIEFDQAFQLRGHTWKVHSDIDMGPVVVDHVYRSVSDGFCVDFKLTYGHSNTSWTHTFYFDREKVRRIMGDGSLEEVRPPFHQNMLTQFKEEAMKRVVEKLVVPDPDGAWNVF